MRRDEKEIRAEIEALKALRPTGPHAGRTTATITAIIAVLEGKGADGFDDLDEMQFLAADDAERWRDGDSSMRPSMGWEGLVE